MSSSKAFTLYSQLPIYLQNLACSVAGLKMRCNRYNRTFHKTLEFLRESQWWPLEKQREHQNQELRRVVEHAYETVPYYREIFDAHKLKPNDIKTTEDLPKLPILDKATVRTRLKDLQSRGWPAKHIRHGHTGGTTGTSLHLLSDRDTQPWQWAVWWRHRQRFGLKLHDSFIVFGGRDVVPLDTMQPPFWRRNLPMHQTYLSVHHLTKANMPAVADYLCGRKVKYYSGYPSALYLVAKYFLDHNITLPTPPAVVVTGSESLLSHQREAISQAFECEVADQYGASEHCANISECEQHRYHMDMEFGAVEFLPVESLPDNKRKIVCTGFHNPVMPLIRYDIGDIATVSGETCSCGRKSPVIDSIDGRTESYIITPDGRQLGRLGFLFHKTSKIQEAQLVQKDISEVNVRIVPTADYNENDEKEFFENFRRYVGPEIQIKLEYLDEIPREANGKFRQIVSRVAPK